jgi:hypothetical protein
MRLFRPGRSRLALATCVLGALVGASASAAQADDPSVDQIGARLAQSRAHLNQLYSASATAAQAFDSATQALSQADADVARERALVRRTRAELTDQSDAVAALTVQQLQGQSEVERWSKMLHSGDPQDLLEQASAYDSAAEAMTAQVDELSARSAVHEAAERQFEEARQSRQQAVDQLADNRAAINTAIARSQSATQSAEAERSALLRKLAQKQQKSLATVTAEQDAVAGNTDTSAQPPPTATPGPSSPTPKPTQPAPTPPPASQPPPAPTDESAADEPYGVWDKIAKCESGGNWHINTGNGYYGGLQFSAATWKSVGGPGLPHQYSREVQIKYAKILQARSGWGQWSCAGARFN